MLLRVVSHIYVHVRRLKLSWLEEENSLCAVRAGNKLLWLQRWSDPESWGCGDGPSWRSLWFCWDSDRRSWCRQHVNAWWAVFICVFTVVIVVIVNRFEWRKSTTCCYDILHIQNDYMQMVNGNVTICNTGT